VDGFWGSGCGRISQWCGGALEGLSLVPQRFPRRSSRCHHVGPAPGKACAHPLRHCRCPNFVARASASRDSARESPPPPAVSRLPRGRVRRLLSVITSLSVLTLDLVFYSRSGFLGQASSSPERRNSGLGGLAVEAREISRPQSRAVSVSCEQAQFSTHRGTVLAWAYCRGRPC